MRTIPLIYFQKRKIRAEEDGDLVSFNDVFERVDKDEEIYVLDLDGIRMDKSNLCSYPKLSEHYKLWIDAGPRVLGDVVDIVMAGATDITIRKSLCPKLDISSIREITESEINTEVDLQTYREHRSSFSLSSNADGFVISSDKDKFKRDFIYDDLVKNLCNKFNVYVIESDDAFFSYWKNIGASGLMIELNMWEKVKHREF